MTLRLRTRTRIAAVACVVLGTCAVARAQSGPSPPPVAELPYTIAPLGGISIATMGTGPLGAGYARIVATSGNTTPAGLAIFGFRQNGILVSEAGVPASALILTGRIYAEVSGAVNTGLALANPNGQPATINFFFTDAAGSNFGAGSTTVAANGQTAAFLNQAPFNGANNINGTFTFTSNVPVGVIAFRGLNNERGEFLITTLPVADLSKAAGMQTVLLPHFADGGGWTTQVVLVSSSDQEAQSGTVQFVGQGTASVPAQPVPVTIGGVTASSFDYAIPARSSRVLRTSNPAGATQVGSVRITPQTGARAPSGLGIFSLKLAGVTVTEAGVVATAPATAQRMYAESSGTDSGSIQTGVAVANSKIDAVNVDFSLTRLDGSATGLSATLTVPGGGGQVAVFLNQIPGFRTLPVPFQGVLRIASTTTTGVAVVGLRGRTNERGEFLITTTPPVNENAPASAAELIFPHFAEGGGYTTQFVLFSGSPGQASIGTLKFFGQSGGVLALSLAPPGPAGPLSTYRLSTSIAGTGSGVISPAGGTYASGTVVTLTATPNAGSTFAGWSGACSGTGPCVVTMSAAKSVTARFDLNTLMVSKTGSGAGAVTSSPVGINCGSTCSANFNAGTVVTLSTAANAGSVFTGWSGACTGTGACTVAMNGAQSVTATFNLLGGSGTALLAGSSKYGGSYPIPGIVTFLDGGTATSVTAYPGQVVVIFNSSTGETAATAFIQANGGTVLTKYPVVAYYLVSVTPGSEGNFISVMGADTRVHRALPNSAARTKATTIIEAGCGSSHATDVAGQVTLYGGSAPSCVNGNTFDQIANGIIETVAAGGGGPTFINLSLGSNPNADSNTTDISGDSVVNASDRAIFQANWRRDWRITLAAIAQMPAAYRENLFVTIAAGNENLGLASMLAAMRSDPKLAAILRDNVVFVTTTFTIPGPPYPTAYPTGNFANSAAGDPDVVVRNNPAAANGTSLAAPSVLGDLEFYVQRVKDATGATSAQALKAIKMAIQTNAKTDVVLTEAIDKAKVILATSGTIAVSTNALVFSASESGFNPGSQNFTIRNAGPAGSTLNYQVSASVPWIGLSGPIRQLSSGDSEFFTASINITGLTAGTYAGTITVADSNSTNKAQTINVTLTITPATSAAPTVTSISPASATAGGPAFLLTVNGTNFVNGSTVRWNGSTRPTTFVSASQLTATISAFDIVTAGTASVTVFNNSAGGGLSNAVNFSIRAPSAGASSPLAVAPDQIFKGCITLSTSKYVVLTRPLIASGGAPNPSYTWSLSSGSNFPAGVTVDASTGVFRSNGQAIQEGIHVFNMTVSDGVSIASGSIQFEVGTTTGTTTMCCNYDFSQTSWSGAPIPDLGAYAVVGKSYGASLYVESSSGTQDLCFNSSVPGATAALPWTWTLAEGELPPGMVIDSKTGVLYGTPLASAAGSGFKAYEFKISIKDAAGKTAACYLSCTRYFLGVFAVGLVPQ